MSQVTSASTYEYPQSQTIITNKFPYVELVEQPSPNTHRFRYASEKRSLGCIMGVNSTVKEKTYPSIKVHGYRGKAVVVISCVTIDDPPMPHPNSVIGKDSSKKGICVIKVNICDDVISFNNLGIQLVKKTDVRKALEIRKREGIDPFSTGYDLMDFPDLIDLNALRLSFQVFIKGPDMKYTVPLKSVATCPIYHKRVVEKPVIVKLSHNSAPVSGGTKIILLCDKICKDDVQVRFFEMRDNWLFWDGYGEFHPSKVHKQVAISLITPSYCNQDIVDPVTVYIELRRKSNDSTVMISKPIPFQMLPLSMDDEVSLKRKRLKLNYDPKTYIEEQIQVQSEKQGNILNQALLMNFRDAKHQPDREMLLPFRDEERHPIPTPIFQDQASALPAPHVTQQRIHYNIHFNQQNNFEIEGSSHPGAEDPFPEPTYFMSQQPLLQTPERQVRSYPRDEVPAQEPTYFMSQQPSLQAPERQVHTYTRDEVPAQEPTYFMSQQPSLQAPERQVHTYTRDEVPAPEPTYFMSQQASLEAQERMNISFSQQYNFESDGCLQPDYEAPFLEPNILIYSSPTPPLRLSQPQFQPQSRPQPQSRSQSRPQPRRCTEPPPPNVTINSNVYLEPLFTNYRQPEPQPTPKYSSNQQEMVMDRLHVDNGDDPFMLQDLQCDIVQLSQQDLQLNLLIGTTESDNISESLSENLSKGLSISADHIQDLLQITHQLNNEDHACQQQGQVQFTENIERKDASATGLTYNPFARHSFDNHMDQMQAAVQYF